MSEDEIKKKKYLSLTLTKKILKNFNEQDEKVLFFSQNIASMKSKAVLGYIYIYIYVSVIIVDEKKCTRYQIMRHHSPHLHHHHHHLVLPPPLFFALQKMMDETTKCFTNLKLSKKGMCRFLQRTPKLSFKSTCPI